MTLGGYVRIEESQLKLINIAAKMMLTLIFAIVQD